MHFSLVMLRDAFQSRDAARCISVSFAADDAASAREVMAAQGVSFSVATNRRPLAHASSSASVQGHNGAPAAAAGGSAGAAARTLHPHGTAPQQAAGHGEDERAQKEQGLHAIAAGETPARVVEVALSVQDGPKIAWTAEYSQHLQALRSELESCPAALVVRAETSEVALMLDVLLAAQQGTDSWLNTHRAGTGSRQPSDSRQTDRDTAPNAAHARPTGNAPAAPAASGASGSGNGGRASDSSRRPITVVCGARLHGLSVQIYSDAGDQVYLGAQVHPTLQTSTLTHSILAPRFRVGGVGCRV